jgi:pyrroloquinoline-quinone synthase
MNNVIEGVLKEIDYPNNPYLVSLREKSFSKADFIETQIQFYMAVVFFSRPMGALAAKIPTPELRIEIVRNVWEEHGEGNPTKIHGNTFIEFLRRLGQVTVDQIDERALWPEVRIFNTTITGACVLDDYLVGCAMMGMIERMFCDISAWIGQGIVENGWLPKDQMIHYALHEDLDIKHSQDFFDVLKPAWDINSENRYLIEQGLRLGATVFYGLYEGLFRGRKRRVKRDLRGPHVRFG